MAILDTKASGPSASRIKKIKPLGFSGHNGKGSLMLHGIGVYVGQDGLGTGAEEETLRLFLINHRVQPNAENVGANSTVELFETKLGSDTMTHIKTFAHPLIFTPNNLVPTGPDSFYFSNDHSVKAGFFYKQLDYFVPGSTIGHCGAEGCKTVTGKTMYANGLAGVRQKASSDHDHN